MGLGMIELALQPLDDCWSKRRIQGEDAIAIRSPIQYKESVSLLRTVLTNRAHCLSDRHKIAAAYI